MTIQFDCSSLVVLVRCLSLPAAFAGACVHLRCVSVTLSFPVKGRDKSYAASSEAGFGAFDRAGCVHPRRISRFCIGDARRRSGDPCQTVSRAPKRRDAVVRRAARRLPASHLACPRNSSPLGSAPEGAVPRRRFRRTGSLRCALPKRRSKAAAHESGARAGCRVANGSVSLDSRAQLYEPR